MSEKFVKYITLGEKANFFHDAYSGVTLSKGETKEVTSAQLVSKRIKSALAQGHLAYADKPEVQGAEKQEPKAFVLEDLVKKLEVLSAEFTVKGKDEEEDTVDLKAMAKKFTMGELKALCADNEIEVEEGDTKVTLLEALLN